jgi:uncharacterized lipoprotein YddW (UPF0748 family)
LDDNKRYGYFEDSVKLQATMQQLALLKLDTIYPVVWNSGFTFYPSVVGQRENVPSLVRRDPQEMIL